MIGKPPTRNREQAVKHAPDVIRGVLFRPLTRYKGSEKPHLENKIIHAQYARPPAPAGAVINGWTAEYSSIETMGRHAAVRLRRGE